MSQLGELAKSVKALQEQAEVYVINPDPPEGSKKVHEMTGLPIPILRDPDYTVAKQFDLPGAARPMRGLVGYVIIDPKGVIRVQRVDIDFGAHAGQLLEIARMLNQEGR